MTKEEFTEIVKNELSGNDESMINNFIDYWTSKPINAKKMLFEKHEPFLIKRRFGTWKAQNKRFKPSKPCPIQGTLNAYNEALKEINNGL